LLNLNNISYGFEQTILFEDICLNIPIKTKIAIVGESGCGKSTLLHIMASFLPPISGNVSLLDNDNLYLLKEKDLINLRRYDISIIFQQHYLFKGFLLNENLQLASIISDEDIDTNLLKRFGLENKQNLHISALSGGEQQRASILRALIKKPRIIFADEPTGNLDNKNSNIVIDVFFEYLNTTDSSLVMVTHNMNIADRCDSIYEIKNKKLHQIK
jgi:putative ABC transport system ATP-binding protein